MNFLIHVFYLYTKKIESLPHKVYYTTWTLEMNEYETRDYSAIDDNIIILPSNTSTYTIIRCGSY